MVAARRAGQRKPASVTKVRRAAPGRVQTQNRFWAPWTLTAVGIIAAALLQIAFRGSVNGACLFGGVFAVAWATCRRLSWRYEPLLAALSGWLFALSAPDLNLYPIAFVAAIPVIAALATAPGIAGAAACGALTGACFILMVFSWGGHAISSYGKFPEIVGLLVYLPFAATLAFRFPLWGALAAMNRDYWRVPAVAFLPISFAACEMTRVEVLPWFLANVLSGNDCLIQAADLVGGPGVSSLIILCNCLLAQMLLRAKTRRMRSATAWAVAAALSVLALTLYGEFRLRQVNAASASAPALRVGVVQPATPIIRNRDQIPGVCDALTSLGRQAARCGPDLIVFSETAAPGMAYQTGGEPQFCETFRRLAAETSTPLLLDNNRVELQGGRRFMWRSAMLLEPSGEISGEYLKRSLAPIGEYVPLEQWFPFLGNLFRYTVRYQAGHELPAITVRGYRIAPQICFEITDPWRVREYVAKDVRLIADIANDSWFGARKEAEQHLALARFRSVENRVPMVRVANTGISAYIDAAGRTQGSVAPIHEPWTDCRAVALPVLWSFYRTWGDVFGWACVAFVALIAAAYLGRRIVIRRFGGRCSDK